ncbi:MAG: mannose-1-phosphate guanylyltransferase [Candidatus Peregrinibacteria bacterium]
MKAVILAGGGGTRLYPLSTPEKPKQFLRLVSDKTLFEQTLERLDFIAPEDIYLAINKNHETLIKQQAPQIPEENILIEPSLRDTASCIGFAAAAIEKRHPNEVMAVIYADHLINNKEEFQKKLKLAEELALVKDTLNIIEVPAASPNTQYGYVKLGPEEEPDVYILDQFTEKPDLETAKKFVESGNYLWNTGIYVWKAKTLLAQYAKYQPETYEKLQKMAKNPETIPQIYPTLDKISLDYAIMEKVDPQQVRIIKADLDWSDIGSWEAVYAELEKRGDYERIKKFKEIQDLA